MKKIISILLCISLLLSLMACAGSGSQMSVMESMSSENEKWEEDSSGTSTPSGESNPQSPQQQPQQTPTVTSKPENPTVMGTFYRNIIGAKISSNNPDVMEVDKKADAMLKKIEDYPDNISVTGKKYYLSSSGSAANSGLSPDSPKQTYAQVKGLLKSGDAVLFRRGDIFRGQIQFVAGVTYAAYGSGIKPRIYGSVDGKLGQWQETSTKGVYTYNKSVKYANIIFNNGEALGRPVQKIGDITKRKYNVYYNGSRISLYSPDGNPGEIFNSIEIVEDYCLMVGSGGTRNVKLQNLCLMYTGVHFLGTLGITKGLEVEGCIMGYCGGRDLYKGDSAVSLGNAIEFWSKATDVYIHDNYIFQSFDAALTHQGPSGTVSANNSQSNSNDFTNIHYENNLLEYNTYDIEAFTCREIALQNKSPNGKFTYNDVYVIGNICRYTGWGWGSLDRPDKNVYNTFKYDAEGENDTNVHVKPLYIENNIFDRSRRGVLGINTPDWNKANMILKNNQFLETVNAKIIGSLTLKDDYMSVINKKFTASGNTFKIVE